MKIGEFAICTGLSKDTIRYYEKMNLLHPEINHKHRNYNKEDIDTVEAILKLKQTGFSLQEIKMLLIGREILIKIKTDKRGNTKST